MPLTGPQSELLRDALLNGFPNASSLEELMLFDMDVRLSQIVSSGPLASVVFNLINWCDAQGRIPELLSAMAGRRPQNQAVQTTIGHLRAATRIGIPAVAAPASPPPVVPPPPSARPLRTPTASGGANEPPSERSGICAIVPAGQGGFRPHVIGTGVLVGDREVLTCAHVVAFALGPPTSTLPPVARVRVCLPLTPKGVCLDGEVDPARWFPPRSAPAGTASDVAVILLDADAPGTVGRAVLRYHTLRAQVAAYGFRTRETPAGNRVAHTFGEWRLGRGRRRPSRRPDRVRRPQYQCEHPEGV